MYPSLPGLNVVTTGGRTVVGSFVVAPVTVVTPTVVVGTCVVGVVVGASVVTTVVEVPGSVRVGTRNNKWHIFYNRSY